MKNKNIFIITLLLFISLSAKSQNDTNTAPILNPIAIQDIQSGVESTFTAVGFDNDTPAQILTYTLDMVSVIKNMVIDPNTGLFSWTPSFDQANDTHEVTITLSDGLLSVNETFYMTAINDAPSFIKGEDQTVSENSGSQIIAIWTSALSDNDGETQFLTFNVSNDNETLFSEQPTINGNGILSYTPADDTFGSAIVTVSLSDSGGTENGGIDTSPEQTFVITVTEAENILTTSNETLFNDTNIYPNPTKNLLIIKTGINSRLLQSLTVRNASGRVIQNLDNHFEGQILELDLSDYPSGVYIIEMISDAGQTHIKKFLKN